MTDAFQMIESGKEILWPPLNENPRAHPRTPAHSISSERLTIDMNHWIRPIMETSESTSLYRFP
jgi:hypothetical protein